MKGWLFLIIAFGTNPLLAVEKINDASLGHYQGVAYVVAGSSGDSQALRAIESTLRTDKKISLDTDARGFNPSLSLCVFSVGKPSTHQLANGDQVATCTFSDGSYYLTWSLWKALEKKYKQ